MVIRPRTSSGRSGFSLVETMFSLSVFSVVLGAVAAASLSSTDAFRMGMTESGLESQARQTLQRIAREVQNTGLDAIQPEPLAPFGSPTLTYQLQEGFEDGAVVWGAARRIELRSDVSDEDDGVDNNSNGIVDEGMVVWVDSPGMLNERSVVWCRGVRELLEGEGPNGEDDNLNGLVDEGGLAFQLDGESMTIRLTLERPDHKGRMLTRTVETTVRMRN